MSIDGCRMRHLRAQLDDRADESCGRCDNCSGTWFEVELDRALVAEAAAFLRRSKLEIEPRRLWSSAPDAPGGRIAAEQRLAVGRALSVYGDSGWGNVVRKAKYECGHVPDDLVIAATELVRDWAPDPAPTWVTCVPSADSLLVIDFAVRLASALGLPVHDVVVRHRPSRPQKEMQNSAQQLRNVYGAFSVTPPVPSTPVLLVDDIVDSRWTLTVIGAALRQAGAGVVHPFVLAKAVSM